MSNMNVGFSPMIWRSLARILALLFVLRGCPAILAASPPKSIFFDTRLSSDFSKLQFLNKKLQDLAGEGAINCGRVHIGQDPSLPTNCGLKAFAARKTFYVRYDIEGIDAEAAIGFSFENVQSAHSVKYVRSLAATYNPFLLDSRFAGRLTVAPCLVPIKLVVTKTGFLICSPNPSEVEPQILSVEPY
ncbi:MAG TPA: hypothetical protein VLK33_18120 [Terriglobales bacterium]|nr:hypothetical protein [Terriglobales bacterium]